MGMVTAMHLRNHTGRVLQRVARGERVIVTRRGEPLAIVQAARKVSRQKAAAKALSAIVAEGVGLLSGSGTVRRFLAEKRAEVEREARRWRRTR